MYVTNGHLIVFLATVYSNSDLFSNRNNIFQCVSSVVYDRRTRGGRWLGAPDGCRGHRGDRIPGLVRAAATASSSCSVPAHCRITPSASVISSVVESVRPSTADAARILSDTAFKHTFNGS